MGIPDPLKDGKVVKVVGGALLLLAPVWFVWQLELLVQTDDLREPELTFFVWEISSLAVYHGLMYLLFIVTWIAGTWVIYTAGRASETGSHTAQQRHLTRTKDEIRARDGYQCQTCGMTQQEHQQEHQQRLHVHHIDDNPENNDPENMTTLCIGCHASLTLEGNR